MDVLVSASSYEYDGQVNQEPFEFSEIPPNTTEITVKNFPLNRLVSGSFSNFTQCKTLTLKKYKHFKLWNLVLLMDCHS